MEIISLTSLYRRRLQELKDVGITPKTFKANNFDFKRTFADFTKDGNLIHDEVLGFRRLIDNERLVNRQVKDLKAKSNGSEGTFRYIVPLPQNSPDCNALRNILVSIQKESKMKDTFIQTSKTETFEAIDDYLNTMEGKFNLVLDMEMKYRDFSRLVDKYIKKCNEIVLLYKDWTKNKRNVNFIITKALEYPEKLHMAFIPINLYARGGDLISTLLICSGFKSVSFEDSEFPRYMLKHIKKGNEKTPIEKLSNCQWCNPNLMCFEKGHKKDCMCLSESTTKLLKKVKFQNIVTFHNLEVLYASYLDIKRKPQFKEKVLNLESMQSLKKNLRLT